MINDTTAGRWLKRVIWLGILANLALALPTLAAPDMMMEFVRLPTATPLLWLVQVTVSAAEATGLVGRANSMKAGSDSVASVDFGNPGAIGEVITSARSASVPSVYRTFRRGISVGLPQRPPILR